jgi:uncharacterized RDD family membrane protein YckC
MDTLSTDFDIEKSRKKIVANLDQGPEIDIDFQVEEINFDSLSFKAINPGLGFHQDKKNLSRQFNIRKKMATETVGPARRRTYTPSLPSELTNPGRENTVKNVAPPAPTSRKNILPGRDLITRPTLAETKSGLQALAWTIDFIFIMTLFSITVVLFFWASGTALEQFIKFIEHKDFLIFAAGLGIMYYLVYFTILDLAGSPGKNFCNLRLIRNDGGRIQFRHTLVRSFITILSAIVLFLPLLMDFQGKLTDTKMIHV